MRNDLIVIAVIMCVFFAFIIYYDHKLVKKSFEATKSRINKIYDGAKAFLFVHFLDNTFNDHDDVDQIN
ncbi:MAG: hypothetical protein EBR82_66525 [Caulobacteraceae bacterium]|nr:hypothetical protein [Caulobacteraceae bacterium]